MNLNQNFWNDRYDNQDTGWDIGEISTPIKAYIDQLNNESLKIIIPGCGNAHEAEYLFKKGFKNVFLIDLSPIALNQFSKRVPNFPKDQLICGDFFNHNQTYDLMIEQTFFCAINPELRSKYAEHAAKILNPKGKLVGLLFNDKLNNDHPPFGGHKKEYISYFNPYFEIEIMDTASNSILPRSNRELFIKLIKK